MPRWVTIHPKAFPFDYKMPAATAILQFNVDPDGHERYVPDEQADFIVERGYGKEGKANAAAKSRKGKTVRRKSAKVVADAPSADPGSNPAMADETVAAADRTVDRGGVDQPAGE